nr:ribonuclease H-like domain-containing protein [Tanacetum cinerariifolium]
MKARGTLLMALPNKDQLKFHSYQDAKLLMEAIKKRYGGNKESKKVQRTLLKQQYENFAASSSETLDQTFDRLQKLINQLKLQGEVIQQEDMNLKLLRSLLSEWKTHALIWRNKAELETISLDDFTSSTNEADTTASGVSTAHTQGTTVNFTSVDNLSDAMICAFLASQPNSPQLAKEDLEKIDPDDLEEMDLHWEMVMLTIRARRFMKRTDRNLDINGRRIGFDKTKVECFNCHKNGYFAREYRAPKTQDNIGKEYERKTVPVETPTENALIAQDGIGRYDWRYQAKEETPTNYAFMALTSSGSSSSSDSEVDSCSKTCMKGYAHLKEIYNSLTSDYKRSQHNLFSYKAGLQSVEERLVHYKKNEVVFTEKINVLNLEVKLRDNVLADYTKNLEKVEKLRDKLKLTLEKLQNSSKSLNTLLNSQVGDKSKAGLGYKELIPESFVNSSELIEKQDNRSNKGYPDVPPPLTENYMPPKRDLRLIDEHSESKSVDVSTVSSSADKTVKTVDITHKDDESREDISPTVEVKTVKPSIEKIEFVKTARETVNTEEYHKVNDSTARDRAVVSGNIGREKENKEKGIIDSGCSMHMTGNKCYLIDFEAYDGGFVSFGDGKRRISGKGKIKIGKLDFDDVYFCKELKYNLFSVSQMCDKKNNVLFTDTECLVLYSNFKLLDESQVLLRVPRKENIYSVDLKSVVPTGDFLGIRFATKGETSGILKTFITEIENQLDCKVKVIRSDNGTEFKNSVITQFCEDKSINREYNVARTLQQNGVAERALVTKPHNKTPYELIRERPQLIDFMKPFGCHVTILNTRDNLGKFEGKGNGPDWLFDIDSLTTSMNYVPVVTRNETNGIAGSKENLVVGHDEKKKELEQEYILIPICTTNPLISQDAKDSAVDARKKAPKVDESEALDNGEKDDQVLRSEVESLLQQDKHNEYNNSTNDINIDSSPVSTTGSSFVNAASQTPINAAGPFASTNAFDEHSFERFSPFKNAFSLPHVPMVTPIDDTGIFGNAYDDDILEEEVDMNNVDSSYTIPEATKFLKDHPQEQMIGSLETPV